MKSLQEIRDPVHGFIGLSDEEISIVNTRVFQRLRKIRQLALANLVYPGALHSRFDHSLGVAHVAGLLGENLLENNGARRLVRLSALLHDVGHGPFSHVSEQILEEFSPAVGSGIREKIHEQLTARILETNKELADHIGRNTCVKITEILKGGTVESAERGIVSGPLDADKQDYLLRDSYYCGVKYGVFDLPRLIDSLCIHDSGTERALGARPAAVPVIEQFVLAKYYMSAQVYRHKIRLISDSMIVRALELGIEKDGLEWLRDLYSYDGSERFIENYLNWDDARLTTALLHPLSGKQAFSTDLFRRLDCRVLFKQVFKRNLREFADPVFRVQFPKVFKDRALRTDVEAEIAEYLSSQTKSRVLAEYVVVNQYGFKSVKEQSRNDEGQIIILEHGGPRTFEEASTLFRSIDARQNDQFVEVYAPFPFQSKDQQRKLGPEFDEQIGSLLEKRFNSQLKFTYAN